MLNEDDTFERLRGIDREEALKLVDRIFDTMIEELGLTGTKYPRLPISELRDRADKVLLPYGWSYNMLMKTNPDEIS